VLEGGEASQFIKFATCPATVRRQQIEENLKMLGWHNLTTPKSHGLSVSPQMMRVKARILPVPAVHYGNGCMAQSLDGRWNLRGLEFLKVWSP
jgi:eukaryotic translation initiation factor 2C